MYSLSHDGLSTRARSPLERSCLTRICSRLEFGCRRHRGFSRCRGIITPGTMPSCACEFPCIVFPDSYDHLASIFAGQVCPAFGSLVRRRNARCAQHPILPLQELYPLHPNSLLQGSTAGRMSSYQLIPKMFCLLCTKLISLH